MSKGSSVTIRRGIVEALTVDNPTAIEFRDDSGELVMIFARPTELPDVWVQSYKGAPDWAAVLALVGASKK